MGRSRIWTVHKTTLEDAIRAQILIDKYGPNLQLRQRLQADYKVMQKLHPALDHPALMQAMLGQMSVAGLDPGSIKEYLAIMDHFGPGGVRAYAVTNAAEAYGTDRGGRKHATDICDEEARAIVTRALKLAALKDATSTILEGYAIVWLLYATGLRAVDIARLWSDALVFSADTLSVVARWTKGIQRVKHRRTVKYPLKGLVAAPAAIKKFVLMRSKKRQRLFSRDASAYPAISNTLKSLVMDLKLAPITTGTFRRLFSTRIDAHCRANGIKKNEMMLHISEDMDKAHYQFDVRPRTYKRGK